MQVVFLAISGQSKTPPLIALFLCQPQIAFVTLRVNVSCFHRAFDGTTRLGFVDAACAEATVAQVGAHFGESIGDVRASNVSEGKFAHTRGIYHTAAGLQREEF